MKHDPFYGKIIERLNGKLDPDTFEACVVDLLRTQDRLFAVPIPGGNDSGMDGAVADFEGEPLPVVTTTAKDVIGNLRKNLDRYKSDGGSKRTCIIATSQKLTQERLDNLSDRAAKRGFTLIQRLEQSALAARLYHASYWCKELLHLTGKPSALSVIPVTSRPLPGMELIGRTEAREWLRNSHGDRLLVGEPGAGKTSLLYEYAIDEEKRTLFVVSRDEGEIANAVRDQEPKVVIVDDAHADIDFLVKLRQLRQEISADFDILATSWNGDRPEIAHKLLIAPENVHELKRLTQDEIKETVINTGITENHWLVTEIMRQATGLPGLAGTLAYFAIQGRWREIYTGDALATDITTFYKNRINGDVAGLLACFALGGKSGMAKCTVSETLNMPILQLRQDLSNLAHGGIIAEVPNRKDFIKVRPPALRHALIRDVFFSGAASLPRSQFESLLAEIPNPKHTALELIGAKSRRGSVPAQLMQAYIGSLEPRLWKERQRNLSALPPELYNFASVSRSYYSWQFERIHEVWEEYAWLGHYEATWVFENFNGTYSLIARPLLQHIPEEVIPRLLDEAIGDARPLNSNTEHPLRLLQDWIKQAHSRTAEPLQRRAKILHTTKTWMSGSHDPAIGYSSMLLAVLPHFDFSEYQPGSRGAITIYSGYLTYEHVLELQKFWDEIIEITRIHTVPNWEEFLNTVGVWAYPFHGNGPDENTRKMMTDFAQRMAADVAEVASDHVGVLHRLNALMYRSYPDFEIVTDDAITFLYPIWNFDVELDEQRGKWKGNVEELAREWEKGEPGEILEKLESIENDMQLGQGGHYCYTTYFCRLLAESVNSPLQWFQVFADSTLPADMVIPFLEKAIERKMEGWKEAFKSALSRDRLKANAISLIFTHEGIPTSLRSEAFRDVARFSNTIESLVLTDQLSLSAIMELFDHDDKSLVGKLSLALWHPTKEDRIPSCIRSRWEDAIVEYAEDDHCLAEIFKIYPDLGRRWLERKFKDGSGESVMFSDVFSSAIVGLSKIERRRLLEEIPDDFRWRSTTSKLVGNSSELFEALLQSSKQRLDILAPLTRPTIDSVWMEFAKLACQCGYSVKTVASCAFSDSISWSGKYSDVIKNQYKQFEQFRNDSDEMVQRIANAGYEYFLQQYRDERKRERDDAVFGRDE